MSVQPPPLSANSLFHFTNSLENLLNILTSEFTPQFCLENFDVLRSSTDEKALSWALPMVCFCDLPLSQTSFHLSVYGDYGIGLTKEWGKKNGISPVLYAYFQSLLSAKLVKAFDQLLQVEERNLDTQTRDVVDDFFDVFSFVKPYEGDLWREGRTISSLRFYNEREWRYVPQLDKDDEYRMGMNPEVFLNDAKRKQANDRMAKSFRIGFEPNDIKYLIVRREEEIVPLIRQVEMIKGRYSYDDVRLLFSRVISAEQIRSDF
jgi:hypothetical protein